MAIIDQCYINGQFREPYGTEMMELINPATKMIISNVRLADEWDARAAIAAAKAAYSSFAHTSVEVRMDYLQRLYDAVSARSADLVDTMIEEYGGPLRFSMATTQRAAASFLRAKELLKIFDFVRYVGKTKVVLEPLGVVGIITPWNASYSFICGKLATAIAAGSTAVIKPSELSAKQTQILSECLHAAGLPAGVINIVTGRGDTVGAEIARHPDIGKISFTGSTAVGKKIAREAVDTMKRVTLELGGKSPNIILDDADLEQAIPLARGIRPVSVRDLLMSIGGQKVGIAARHGQWRQSGG